MNIALVMSFWPVLMRERYSPLAVVDFLIHLFASERKSTLSFFSFVLAVSSRWRERESPVLASFRDLI